MRILIAGLFLTSLAFAGEDSKPAVPAPPSVAPTEKVKGLDELANAKLRRIESDRLLLEERYHIADYQSSVQPLLQEQNEILRAKCTEAGASQKDIDENRCGVNWKDKYPEPEFKFGKVIYTPPPPSPSAPPVPATKPK